MVTGGLGLVSACPLADLLDRSQLIQRWTLGELLGLGDFSIKSQCGVLHQKLLPGLSEWARTLHSISFYGPCSTVSNLTGISYSNITPSLNEQVKIRTDNTRGTSVIAGRKSAESVSPGRVRHVHIIAQHKDRLQEAGLIWIPGAARTYLHHRLSFNELRPGHLRVPFPLTPGLSAAPSCHGELSYITTG